MARAPRPMNGQNGSKKEIQEYEAARYWVNFGLMDGLEFKSHFGFPMDKQLARNTTKTLLLQFKKGFSELQPGESKLLDCGKFVVEIRHATDEVKSLDEVPSLF